VRVSGSAKVFDGKARRRGRVEVEEKSMGWWISGGVFVKS